jgi:Ca2+-transporting ATPase
VALRLINEEQENDKMPERQEHLQAAEAVLNAHNASVSGLAEEEVASRQSRYGLNVLKEAPKKSLPRRVWEQIRDPMILILAIAAVVSGVLGEVADMCIIFVVIAINTILGIMQESKAEAAIEALQKMSAAVSKARRGGEVVSVPSAELVPGDIVLFEAGDAVPADIRLIEAASLKIEEAALTGESVPADKCFETLETAPDKKEVPLGDRVNMAYMGTSVVYGRGAGVVVRTGMDTEMGKIANAIANQGEERTPLQNKLAQLSKTLSVIVLAICVAIFALGLIRGGTAHLFESFMTAVSLAVAAIPEGLVVVVTVMLSVGVKNMAEQRAIIRRLTAVETLGCAGVICSDKTGTLTQNKMTVVEHLGDTIKLRAGMQNCNDATFDTGDPTEIALKVFGAKADSLSRVGEAPFDSDRKLMSTIHKLPGGGYVQYTKGAPDELLKRCVRVDISNETDNEIPLSEDVRALTSAENKNMADRALRVLGGAMKLYDDLPADFSPESLEKGLIFVGLCGMIDPVRPEVKTAIDECKAAGITAVMITGDHKDTAVAIAKELGIAESEAQALSGHELSEIPDDGFDVTKYRVYARVQPEHKVRIVSAWRALKNVTAMTGDGVNDAPAIKAADIGVGMGITGTDVTKNVADMVLADDNFATIVGAVREGRRIYENIRKAVLFLMSTNAGEIFAIFAATIAGFTLLQPIHLLWINLVTDTFPALALGVEKAEEDAMSKPPRDASEGIFAHGSGFISILQGAYIALSAILSYFAGGGGEYGVSMAFVTLSLGEAFHALNMRSRVHSLFAMKRQNFLLWGAVAFSVALTLCLVYVPGINTVFSLEALAGNHLLAALGLAVLIIPIAEIVKIFCRLLRLG